ncbi:hypothetical protein K466DRAFT_590640, partial [Polyporus arcularius HHB13444]
MTSDPVEELRRVKSELQFYKDLAKEQAGQIAALKAEIAYVKQHHQPQTSAAAPPAQPQASGSRASSIVKRPDSPPPSVAGSSNDPYIIEDDEELEEIAVKASVSPPRRADSQSNEIHPNQVPLQQMQPIKSPPRSFEKLPKKRTSLPVAGTGRYFPEYEPSLSSRRWGLGDSPRKKPRLVPEVASPPAPVAEDNPVAGPSNDSPDIDAFQSGLVADPTNTQDDLENDRAEAAGLLSTQHDLDALENGPVAGLSNTQRDFDDEWDMSPLSSLPSTSSRSSSPAIEDQARDDTTHLLQSASRELSYYDPSAENEREARLGQASQSSTSQVGLSRLALQLIAAPVSGVAVAVRRERLAGLRYSLTESTVSTMPMSRYPDSIQRGHPEDQYLFEFDRDEKGRMQLDTDGVNVKFTDRAKAAQEAKWRRLSAIFGPRKTIPRSMAACNGGNPPRLAYGWAHTLEYLWEYAKFHNIELDVTGDNWLAGLAGTTLIKYGELTEEQKTNEELISTLKG